VIGTKQDEEQDEEENPVGQDDAAEEFLF